MSHSIFTGRPWSPGEPLFLAEDTDAAIALQMEERDTCPQCGMLKVWCRDGLGHPFTDYEVAEEICQASLRVAHHRGGQGWQAKHEATREATQLAPRFRKDHEPDPFAGLDLGDGGAEQ